MAGASLVLTGPVSLIFNGETNFLHDRKQYVR